MLGQWRTKACSKFWCKGAYLMRTKNLTVQCLLRRVDYGFKLLEGIGVYVRKLALLLVSVDALAEERCFEELAMSSE